MSAVNPESGRRRGISAVRVGLMVGALACLAMTAACGDRAQERSVPAASTGEVEKARTAAAELGKRLKGLLMETIGTEGPVAAIRVCSEEAPAIARQVSAESGMQVSRTSLRVRNPENAPDARERAVLELWQERMEDGMPAAALEPFVNQTGEFLWMRPIVLEGPCLMCHGGDVPEDVAAAIAERYPQDRATGYAAGDLRGAFVVR